MPATAQLSAAPGGVVWAFVAGAALYRSSDRGETWDQRPLPPYQGGGGPPEIAFVDAQNGWYSTGGVPETECNGAGEQVWRTTDGGAGWQVVASVTGPAGGSGIAFTQCKQGLSFIDSTQGFLDAWDDNHQPTIYRTSDAGQTWLGSTVPNPPGFTTQPGGFALRAGLVRGFGSTLLVPAYSAAGGSALQYVYRSLDGGATWTFAASPPNPGGSIGFVSATRWLQIIEPDQSMETTDAGKTWHAYPSDYGQAAPIAPEVVFGDPVAGYATVRGEIQRTTDGGLHWAHIKTPGTHQSG
ncbi:MAG: WD40/YVTN/BNR-like repeat-containing protein [Candidatus Dormibacteraceae bacterium]